MASIDVKDAYYSEPVAATDQKYLEFEWNGIVYKFTSFPNELSLCLRKFTKMLKRVYCYLRKDDANLQVDGYQNCLNNVGIIKFFGSLDLSPILTRLYSYP